MTLWYICTMKYYSKKNVLMVLFLILVEQKYEIYCSECLLAYSVSLLTEDEVSDKWHLTGANLRNILSEMNQTQKDKFVMVPFM